MARSKTFDKGAKKFLNKELHELGLISWRVSKDGDSPWTNAHLTIGDCEKRVNLDFDVDRNSKRGEYDSLDARLRKLDVMIDELHEMRRTLIAAAEAD